MPLTRHRIRNEYRLADSELYRAADKDDPEALLEGVAMAGLVGVLRQLGDLAEFAAEIFHDLHEEVMATATRGHGLVVRVQQLEAEFSSIEKAFLSQTSHSFMFYNTGIIWHPNVRMDQNLIVQGDLPRFVMDSYEECRGPPRLFLLDRFDVAGAGSCLKRYTDPSFFKVDPSSFGMMNSEGQREKKTRKVKKKGSRWRNGETPEVIPTSNVKLQQLFLEGSVENYINDPAHRVKLKRRLNGFPFDSKPGKTYMEKFLETSPTDHSTVHEISVNSSTLKVPSNITGVSGIEILEISTVSPEKDSLRRKSGPRSSPCVEDTKQRQSMVGLREEGNYGISELTKPNPNSEASIALSLHEELDEKEIMVVGERKVEGSANGYQFGDIASEVENYTDALTTMDSEMETETECRAKDNVGFLNIEPQVSYEEQQGHLAHFSDDQSMGNPTATDDGNSSFRKRIFSFPYNDSPSNLVENTPSDGDFSAKVFPSSNHNELHTEHIYQEENRKSTGDNLASSSDVSNVTSLTKDDILCDLSADNNPVDELDGEDPNVLSHSSLHLSSILGLATATKSNEILLCNLLQAEFTEEECKKFSVDSQIDSPKSVASHREEQKLGSALPELETRVPDVKPDSKVSEVDETMSIEELSGDMRRAECMEEECMKFTVDSQIDSPKSVASHREEQTLDSALPELEIHIPDVKTDEKVSEVDEMKNSEDLLADILQAECTEEDCTKFSVDSRIDSPKSVASHREEQTPGSALPELETCVPDVKTDRKVSEVDETRSEDLVGDMPPQAECTEEECTKFSVDSQIDSPKSVVGVSYCSEGDLYGALNAADGEELCGFSSEMGMVGKNAANVKFPDLPLSPGVHLDVDDAETETIHSEAMIVANVANTHDDNNRDNGRSLTTCATKLQDLRQNGLAIYEVCSPENFQESGIEKVDQQIVASSDLDYVTCNTVPCDDSKSELLNNVTAASMAALSRNSLHVAESHSDLFSSHQNDLDSKSKSPKQINFIESIEDAAPSPSNHIAEMRTPLEGHADASSEFCAAQLPCQTWKSEFLPQLDVSEQATDPTNSVVPPFGLLPEIAEINLGEMPPLPPLPPVQWRMGKVQHSSLAPERDLVGHYLYPSLQIFPFTADEKAELDHLGTEGENTRPLNPSLPLSAAKVENSQQGYENLAGNKDHSAPLSLQVPTMVNCGCNEDDNPFLALPTISNGSSQHGFLATERGTEHPTLNPFSPSMDVEDPISIYPPGSLEEKLIQSQHQLPSQMSSEDKKIQSTFMVSEGEAANYPETSFPRPDKQEDQPKHFFYYPEGETFLSSPAPLVPSEDGKPNGIRQIKLPRPRNPLIDAVVALDKSKLKKVTDRVRPKIGQELDERNSLLEQIRTKSFNLKPAVKTRPSNKGPKTNLKVAAILEKANAIRQALAGSDEDDDDSDGWSDS